MVLFFSFEWSNKIMRASRNTNRSHLWIEHNFTHAITSQKNNEINKQSYFIQFKNISIFWIRLIIQTNKWKKHVGWTVLCAPANDLLNFDSIFALVLLLLLCSCYYCCCCYWCFFHWFVEHSKWWRGDRNSELYLCVCLCVCLTRWFIVG